MLQLPGHQKGHIWRKDASRAPKTVCNDLEVIVEHRPAPSNKHSSLLDHLQAAAFGVRTQAGVSDSVGRATSLRCIGWQGASKTVEDGGSNMNSERTHHESTFRRLHMLCRHHHAMKKCFSMSHQGGLAAVTIWLRSQTFSSVETAASAGELSLESRDLASQPVKRRSEVVRHPSSGLW